MSDDKIRIDAHRPELDLSRRLVRGDLIADGGMGEVREVLDTNLNRPAAMKVIHKHRDDGGLSRYRFVEEAQVMAQLDHPNIVPVYELSIQQDGRLFFTMKRVRGRTFSDVLRDHHPDERPDAALLEQLKVLIKVCDAVALAHSRGVIHRDLKPENVMVGDYGQVYVMDWGVARIKPSARSTANFRLPAEDRHHYPRPDERGRVIGTPAYMAPEQALADHRATDERTDVYALGGILYEILTGLSPHAVDATTIVSVVKHAAIEEVKPPEEVSDTVLPPDLCRIALRALARNPDERYQSVSDMKSELERCIHGGMVFSHRSYGDGAIIVRQGELGDEAFIIVRGRCLVRKRMGGKRVNVRVLSPGEVFGETAALTERRRTATVMAQGDVTVKVVTRAHFQQALGMGFWLGPFFTALAERFHEMDARLARISGDHMAIPEEDDGAKAPTTTEEDDP